MDNVRFSLKREKKGGKLKEGELRVRLIQGGKGKEKTKGKMK